MKVLMDTIINRSDDKLIKEMFSRILVPFALEAKGLPPVYNGMPVEHLGIGKGPDSAIFSINENKLAMVNLTSKEVSAFGSNFVPVSEEDIQVIDFIITKLETKAKEENFLDTLLKAFSQSKSQNN